MSRQTASCDLPKELPILNCKLGVGLVVSTFKWLDFSASDRQRTMQVLDLFREKSTLDELGVGLIRDAFADHFFPGTSTIQTRARYFLFIPWIMKHIGSKAGDSQELLNRLRSRESKLITALLKGKPDEFGIIGKEAKASLKRMPSTVYWRGLNVWGIRRFDGSIEQYAREMERRTRSAVADLTTDDGEPVQSSTALWSSSLPSSPEDFLESTTFDLTDAESAFLKQQICLSQPDSIIAQLLRSTQSRINSEWIWDSALQRCFTTDTRQAVENARRFALCVWGSSLLYTLMVAQLKHGAEWLVADAESQLGIWQQQLEQQAEILQQWDLGEFWLLIQKVHQRPPEPTIQFVEAWIAVCREVSQGQPVWQEPCVQKLINDRESRLKGPRSRLRRDNSQGRDSWQGSVSSGPMDYRWSQTRTILNDILDATDAGSVESGISGDSDA